LNKSQRL